MPNENIWICPDCFEMNSNSKTNESSIQCICCEAWFSWYEVEEIDNAQR